ncbi:uncharacterized protein LOC144639269 [Oculina patagonica]
MTQRTYLWSRKQLFSPENTEATQRQLSDKTLLILSLRPNSEKEAGSKNLLHFALNLGEPVDCAAFLEQNLKRSTFKLCPARYPFSTSDSHHRTTSTKNEVLSCPLCRFLLLELCLCWQHRLLLLYRYGR